MKEEKVILNGLYLPKLLLEMFPPKLAIKYRVLPVRVEGGNPSLLVLASQNPPIVDLKSLQEINKEIKITLVLGILDDFEWFLKNNYI